MRLRGQRGIGRVFENPAECLRIREFRRAPPLLRGHIDELLIRFRAVVVDVERVATADLSWLDVQQIRVRLHDRMSLA